MRQLLYSISILILISSCSEYQKALNSDEVSVKFNLGTKFYDNAKYSKASRLFAQILPQYRGKPQAQKLTYMQAMCFYNTKDYNSSSYQMERFVNSYPDSEKVEEMAFLGAKSYYLMAPIYSKDPEDTRLAIDKLQQFINSFPESKYISDANILIFQLDSRLELKEFNIALQYNILSDFQASIKSFDNFLIDFPGSKLREKAMYYRFDSAYKLAINSVTWKQSERIQNAVSFFNTFKNNYKKSDLLEDMENKMSDLIKLNNI
tara:strand:- start:3009 stop:3794 length:786 start_codon:yes stop_codon:yes gene_type:complete